MASRGNSSNGGGCFGSIIAFFVLFFLPAWVTGDSFGWGVLIVWWIILGGILFAIVAASSSSNTSSSINTQRQIPTYIPQSSLKQNNVQKNVSVGSLKVDTNQLNRPIMEGYSSKLKLKANLEKTIDDIQQEQQKYDDNISDIRKQQADIRAGKDKPFFTSKKKWQSIKQPDIEKLDQEIKEIQDKQKANGNRISQLRKEVNTVKFIVFDESNEAFEKLKSAFEKVKKSCNVEGTPSLKDSMISISKRDQDLQYIQYKTDPYGILLDNYRFYIFPNGIWVFEGDGKLVGVYKPKAIKGYLETREVIKESYYSMYSKKPAVYDDTKIVTKDIPHHTWLHTCRDGSPDMRYRHNPMQTYYTKQEYYIECSFNLEICGCKLKYEISSYDNCVLLVKALLAYCEIKANKDVIPIFLDLLKRCSEGRDISMIQEKIADH